MSQASGEDEFTLEINGVKSDDSGSYEVSVEVQDKSGKTVNISSMCNVSVQCSQCSSTPSSSSSSASTSTVSSSLIRHSNVHC